MPSWVGAVLLVLAALGFCLLSPLTVVTTTRMDKLADTFTQARAPLRKGMKADPGVLKGLTDMLDRRRIVSGINLCPTSLSVFVCLCVSFSRYLSPSLPRLLLL